MFASLPVLLTENTTIMGRSPLPYNCKAKNSPNCYKEFHDEQHPFRSPGMCKECHCAHMREFRKTHKEVYQQWVSTAEVKRLVAQRRRNERLQIAKDLASHLTDEQLKHISMAFIPDQ